MILYTIKVMNNGPSTYNASEYQVTDAVPAGTTLQGNISAPGFSCDGTTSFPCNNNTALAPGEMSVIKFSVKVNADYSPIPSILPNKANVAPQGGNITDTNQTNNMAMAQTAINNSQADLQLTKTANPASVLAGSNSTITYTINYRNNGPADANAVVISDTVPANLIPVGTITAAGLSCNGATPTAGAQFTCSPTANGGVLASGASGTITFQAKVPANVAPGTIVANGATIASTGQNATPDPNTANNTQNPTSTLVTGNVDLSIVKARSQAIVVAGGPAFTYTLTVNNAGPSDAQNVVVNDPLPPGIQFITASQTTGTGFICTGPAIGETGTVTCTKGVMASGENAVITITARAAEGANPGNRTNTAAVTSSSPESNTSNNSSSADVDIRTSAAVTMTKLDNPDAVTAGDLLTYTIAVTNNGPSVARNVTVSDPIPANTSFVSLSGSGILANCSFAGGSVSCVPSEMADGETATLTVVVRVNPNAPAGNNQISNTATVNWNDTNPNNNPDSTTANAQTSVNRLTDLAITKSDSPQAVVAGNQIIYMIMVTNNGPSTANIGDVVVKDAVPANTTNVSLTGSGPFSGCTLTLLNGAGCTNSAAMAPGEKATLTYTVTVNPGTPVGFITNMATVAASDPAQDPNLTNNSAAVKTAVGPNADLQLTKTANPQSVVAGDVNSIITYTITYLNSGASDANAVVIDDTIPANLIPVGTITAAGLSCNGQSVVAGGQLVCSPLANQAQFGGSNAAGVLPAGAGGTITFQVRVPANVAGGTLVSNGASIASTGPNATPDPNTANNTQNPTSTLVTGTADLSVTKLDTPDPVIAGNVLTYTLGVNNAGPSDAQNVVVTDALPAGTTFISASSSDAGFICTNSNNTVTCNKATLATGASTTITIKATVNASVPNGTTLRNTATVSSTTPDSTPGNNTSPEATTQVQTDADITIVKTSNPDPVVAGKDLTYTISVTSNGTSDAQSVKVVDPLPAGLTYTSVTGTGVFSAAGACSYSAGTITCNATPGGVMPVGATANITVVAKVNSSVAANTNLANTATVTWTDGDGNPNNDTASAINNTKVVHESDMKLKKEAPSEVIAGQRMDYTITVTNMGPSDVLGGQDPGTLMVMDTLPNGVKPVQPMTAPNLTIVGPGGVTCSYDSNSNKVTCVNAAGVPGNFPIGSVLTIILKVQTPSNLPDGTNIVNCANVSLTAPEFDPVSGNNESCAATVVRTSADLTVGKTAAPVIPVPGSNPPAVRAGENIRYTIAFGNAGPSDAVNVKVTDNIPGNTAAVADQFPITVLATGGGYTGGNSVNVVCSLDTVTNKITCMPMGNTGLIPSLDDGVLPAGVTGQLVFDVAVNASVTGGSIIGNGANIASAANSSTPGTPDPNTANNTSLTTSTPVVAGSVLSITKVVQSAVTEASNPGQTGPVGATSPTGSLASPGTANTGTAVLPGTQLTYRLLIENNGPSDIANVQVVDTLPAGVTYVGANQVSGNATFTCFNTGGAVTCNAPVLPTAQPGVDNTAAIDVVVDIDPALKASLVNNARANGTVTGFNKPVGAATQLTTPVRPVSDLATTKTHMPDPVVAGTNVMYTVKVQNFGPSTAMMTTVVDNLPKGQTLVSAEVLYPVALPGMPPAMTCSVTTPATGVTGDVVTCVGSMGGLSLGPNEFVTLKLTARVDSCTDPGAYVNTATATSTSALPVTPRNVWNDTVNVIARPDLSIVKTAPEKVIAGTEMTYTLKATNNGPSCAKDLKITDVLPVGTVFVSASADGATLMTPAVDANGTVMATWPGATAPGQVRTLNIVVRVCSEVACNTILDNTGTVSYTPRYPDPLPQSPLTTPPFVAPADWDKDPDLTNNSSKASTKVEAQSDLSLVKSGPATAKGGEMFNYTLSFSNLGPSNAAGVTVTDTLPKGFTVVGQPTSTIDGTTFEIKETGGVVTVKATIGELGADKQCATNRPKQGSITIKVMVPTKHPIIGVQNTAVIATTNCLADPNLANNTATFDTFIGPGGNDVGQGFPADSEVSDQKAGSILFYPIYTSDAVNNNLQNTRISMTNISATESVCIHLFAVDGSSCSVLDMFVCLTPNQTTSFLASDLDPGQTGYMMAVAVDCETGLPISFNCLIGDEYVKFSSGHEANLGAESISAEMMYPAGTDLSATTATLRFDGMNYNRLPRILAADNIQSTADGNSTMLIINRVGGNFSTTGGPIGSLTGLVFDDVETSYSFTASSQSCQFRSTLSNTFPRSLTPFSRIIPAGRSGWMKFWTFEDRALFGTMINFNPNVKSNGNAYNQGHNLHKLTLTDKAEIIIPIFIPSCQ